MDGHVLGDKCLSGDGRLSIGRWMAMYWEINVSVGMGGLVLGDGWPCIGRLMSKYEMRRISTGRWMAMYRGLMSK